MTQILVLFCSEQRDQEIFSRPHVCLDNVTLTHTLQDVPLEQAGLGEQR